MPLTRGDWWLFGRPVVKGQTDLDNTDFTTGCVLSESLSPNALRRSVAIALPAPPFVTTTAAQLLTSGYKFFTPSAPIKVAALTLTALTSWTMTTVQTTAGNNAFGFATVFAGANQLGVFTLPTSSGTPQGTPLPSGTLTNASVPSGTALTIAFPSASSSGMVIPAHLLQIDFDSTG